MKSFWMIVQLLIVASVRGGELTNSAFVTTNLSVYVSSGSSMAPESEFQANQMIFRTFKTSDTNGTMFRVLRYQNQRYVLRLFDQSGNPVPLRDSSHSELPRKSSELGALGPQSFGRGGKRWEFLMPSETFDIKNKGVYEMEVRMRICIPMTTNGLPDYPAMSDGLKFIQNTNFGIVESSPLRVRIINK